MILYLTQIPDYNPTRRRAILNLRNNSRPRVTVNAGHIHSHSIYKPHYGRTVCLLGDCFNRQGITYVNNDIFYIETIVNIL